MTDESPTAAPDEEPLHIVLENVRLETPNPFFFLRERAAVKNITFDKVRMETPGSIRSDFEP